MSTTTPERASFAKRLAPLVVRVGGPTVAGELCGVARQTVNLWLREGGNPNAATQAGALLILRKARKSK